MMIASNDHLHFDTSDLDLIHGDLDLIHGHSSISEVKQNLLYLGKFLSE